MSGLPLLMLFGLSLLAVFMVFGVAFAWVVRLASVEDVQQSAYGVADDAATF